MVAVSTAKSMKIMYHENFYAYGTTGMLAKIYALPLLLYKEPCKL